MSDEWIGKRVIPIEGNPAQLCSSVWTCRGYENGKLVLEGAPGIRYNLAPRYVMLAPEIEKKDVLERAKRVEYPDSALRILPELIAEVERRRAALAHELDLRNRHIESLEARIKELEATKERLQSAPKSGLYGKYIIQKADGSPVDPEADYFILRLDADPVARIAALEYAIQTDDQKLGEMLEKRVMDHVFSKDDQCRKRVEGWPIGQIKQLRKQIAAKDARIKELEALNELNHKNMRSWLDTTTDKEFLDKLSSEIGFKDAYIKLLEAAFLRSNAAMRYYQEGNRGPWPQVGDKFKEPYLEKAREKLERIKEGNG